MACWKQSQHACSQMTARRSGQRQSLPADDDDDDDDEALSRERVADWKKMIDVQQDVMMETLLSAVAVQFYP